MSEEQDSIGNTETENINVSRVDNPEIGFVIVAIGLSTVSIASGYGSPYYSIKIFSLFIFLLAMWGACILYWHILFEKIPDTMEIMSGKTIKRIPMGGQRWILKHWLKLVFYTMFFINQPNKDKTLECGYLTILIAMYGYWIAGILLYTHQLHRTVCGE